MKRKHIDTLHDRVCALCVQLREDTGFLLHLSDVLYGVIELARTGHTVEAIGVAREVTSYLAEGHARYQQSLCEEPLAGFSAYGQVQCNSPRPAATVQRAAEKDE